MQSSLHPAQRVNLFFSHKSDKVLKKHKPNHSFSFNKRACHDYPAYPFTSRDYSDYCGVSLLQRNSLFIIVNTRPLFYRWTIVKEEYQTLCWEETFKIPPAYERGISFWARENPTTLSWHFARFFHITNRRGFVWSFIKLPTDIGQLQCRGTILPLVNSTQATKTTKNTLD